MARGGDFDFLPDERAGERDEGLTGLHPLWDKLFNAFHEQMLARHGAMGPEAVQDFATEFAGADGLFVFVDEDRGRVVEWRWIKKSVADAEDADAEENDCQVDDEGDGVPLRRC
jgi:hypothetical protein